MTFCNSCGFDKGSGRYCPKCGSMSDQSAVSVETNPAPVLISAPQSPTMPQSVSTPFANPAFQGQQGSGSPAFGVCLLILGTLGVLSTFIPWLSGNGDSASGWDLRELMEELGLFAEGAVLLAIGSVGTLIVALLLLANKNKAMNRFGVGIGLLTFGLISAVGTGNTFNDLNEYLGDSVNDILAEGLVLGSVVAVAGMISGVLAMALKSLTGSR